MKKMKIKAFDKRLKIIVPDEYISILSDGTPTNNSFENCESDPEDWEIHEFVMQDKNGNDIFSNIDKFNFKYFRNAKYHELIGSFDWCDSELRYEIDIHNHESYACLSFTPDLMSEFELIAAQ